MTRIIRWYCKGLRARNEKVQLFQPFCICLQEVMLENVKYNLGGEYKFYATIPLGQRSKGRTAVAIKKEVAHKRLNIRTTLQVVAMEIYMAGKINRIICSIYLPPLDQSTEPKHNRRSTQLPSQNHTASSKETHSKNILRDREDQQQHGGTNNVKEERIVRAEYRKPRRYTTKL